jgi:serine/threonine-protein kinase HipA
MRLRDRFRGQFLTFQASCHLIDGQIRGIRDRWDVVCEEAGMSAVDRAFLWERRFLNAYALEGYQAA